VQRAQTRLASRSTQHVTVALATCLLALVLGCRDESDSPTGPDAPVAPALASAAAGTLSFRQSSVTSYPGTDAHTCGVTTDDRAYCWGAGMWGQLGDGEEAPDSCGNPCRTHPVAVAGGLAFAT
jgi:hypothetical protein